MPAFIFSCDGHILDIYEQAQDLLSCRRNIDLCTLSYTKTYHEISYRIHGYMYQSPKITHGSISLEADIDKFESIHGPLKSIPKPEI